VDTTLIDKLAWIYLKDKKILMARSAGKDVFYISGGKRELGESNEEALRREVTEELTVVLRPPSIRTSGHVSCAGARQAGRNDRADDVLYGGL